MIFKYCPKCGLKLSEKFIGDEGLVPFCENCNEPVFNYNHPCVIMIVENEDNQICIIRQSYGKHYPVLVAGYVKYGNTIEDTIIKEVYEEIGQKVIGFTFLKSYIHSNSDNLMLAFHVDVIKQDFRLSNELIEANWYSYNDALLMLNEAKLAKSLLNYYLDNKEKI